ncbi:polysaccharide biosynthesis C-terminal domain-containing protein [Vibrio aestuarianus]|uniref:oligosaccharide flippase family protein n=1 Tax=Vibrio aestuarianus TaxID=28171 RepID=UPI00237D11A5|nr:polysaccharide biosynthesis C-terminal domain-containing protein [Vibrio aestuarianus]MDE1330733.1 polysaccharide biosynthesis C-terminal domain-containing protein [Vibrio aestuarianus]
MRKYLYNIAVVMLERVAMLVFQLWMTSHLVHHLATSGFGEWALVFSGIAIIMSLSVFAIDLLIIRDIAASPSNKNSVFLSGLIIQLVGWLAASVAALLIFSSQNQLVVYSTYAIVLANFFIIMAKPWYWEYTAKVESKYKSISTLFSLLIYAVGVYFTVKHSDLLDGERSVFIYPLYYVVNFLVSACVYFFGYRASFSLAYCPNKFREYTKAGALLVFSTVSVVIFAQSDVIMLKMLTNSELAGEYAASVKLSSAIFMIAGVIGNTFYPKLLGLNGVQRHNFLFVIMAILAFLSVIGSLVVVVLAEPTLALLYGSSASDTMVWVLRIHIWCSVFVFLGAFSSRYLHSKHLYRFEVIKTSLGAVLNVVTNFLLIPSFGAVGAAVASLLSYWVANHLAFLFFSETRELYRIQQQAFICAFSPQTYPSTLRNFKCFFQS